MTWKKPQALPHSVLLHGHYGRNEVDNRLWTALLPQARQRLIDEGLFTVQGTLTDKGREVLKRQKCAR